MFKKTKQKKNRHFKLVKQENMLDSLNLSIMYVPKQKKIEFYISFIFTKNTNSQNLLLALHIKSEKNCLCPKNLKNAFQ